jgi:MtN3 and saliva related transmembrane protein
MIKHIEIIGILAGTLTTIAHVPQCYTLYKSTNVNNDVSLWTYIILFIGLVFWLVYGLKLKLPSVIGANFISLILSGVIIGRIIYLNNLKKQQDKNRKN